MKKRTLIFDLDDVVISNRFFIWGNRYLEQIGKPTIPSIDKLDPNQPNAMKAMFKTQHELVAFIKWLVKHDTYKGIKPIEGSIDTLRQLNETDTILFASSCYPPTIASIDPVAALREFSEKMQWVKENIPFLPPENFQAVTKKDILQGFSMTDDTLKNLDGTFEKKILFEAWHNRNISNEVLASKRVVRSKNWDQILEILK